MASRPKGRKSPPEQPASTGSTSIGSGRVPILSILIPAFNYPEGVSRILGGLDGHSATGVEILVGDDSSASGVESVAALARGRFEGLSYHRNEPSLGACGNWNDLLARAKGDYCLLLHHDEFPVAASFITDLTAELTAPGALST